MNLWPPPCKGAYNIFMYFYYFLLLIVIINFYKKLLLLIFLFFHGFLDEVLGMVLGKASMLQLVGGCFMAKAKREKSARYPGVYYRLDSDGKGRTFYIVYRRGGA